MNGELNSGDMSGNKPAAAGKRRRPLASLVILGFLVSLAFLTRNYYYNFVCGPFPVDDHKLARIAQEPGSGGLLSYVELTDRELVPTGITQITTVNDRQTASDPYFMTRVGEQMMIVQAKSVADGRHFVGPIYHVPESVEQDVIAKVVLKHPELQGKFLPVMVNANAAFRVIGYIGLAFCVPAALICLFSIARSISTNS